MKKEERAYPIHYVGHRKTKVVAITQQLDDGSTQTVVMTLAQLERLTKRAKAEIEGAIA